MKKRLLQKAVRSSGTRKKKRPLRVIAVLTAVLVFASAAFPAVALEPGNGEILQEDVSHEHGADCYDENGVLICETETNGESSSSEEPIPVPENPKGSEDNTEETEEETGESDAPSGEPSDAGENTAGSLEQTLTIDDGQVQSTDSMLAGQTADIPAMAVSLDSENLEIQLTEGEAANPTYTVQYYANVEVADRDENGYLTIIDTDNGGTDPERGGNLPKNGVTPETTALYLVAAGNGKQKIRTRMQLTELYTENEYQYLEAPSLPYVNIFRENGNYRANEVWVLQKNEDGSWKNPNSTDRNDWKIFENIVNPTELHFTNNPETAEKSPEDTILIEEGVVIRLVANSTTDTYQNEAIFYDYDITSDGSYTYQDNASQGINSPENYSDSGSRFAFGNANTGMGLEGVSWENNGKTNWINQYNRSDPNNSNSPENSFKGCTFGLVTGLDSAGRIQYAQGITAPNLFNEGNAVGKTVYEDWKLGFRRTGDTYTLSSVTGDNTNLTGLEYFNNPAYPTDPPTIHTNIWTNNFWPMDNHPGTDGRTGAYYSRGDYVGNDGNNDYPPSDDGLAHNNLFGMQYEVKFELTEDYVGPLEYYFFGDDDMWVFLDGRLVCDIGGVHSSVGAYVNLWDYIEKGDAGEHTLSFFYTERGLSGSTCYMQFTLPSVSSAEPEYYNSSLRIGKEVVGSTDLNQEFSFDMELTYEDDSTPTDDYTIVRYNAQDEKIGTVLLHEGKGSFKLKAGEYAVIDYLPLKSSYTITETNVPGGCTVSNTTGNGQAVYDVTADGTITEGKQTQVVFTNTFRPKLPDTGGPGTRAFTFGGAALAAAAALWYLRQRNRKSSDF